MGGPGLGRMRARSLCSIDILHGSLWRVTRDTWCRHDLWLALTLSAVITRLSLRSDDDKLSSESAKQREDFHSDYFCQTDGSHPDFPHTEAVITSISRCHVLSPHTADEHSAPMSVFPVTQVNVRRAFVIATRAKYPRNENTSQPLSLYDWPIRELGAAKRNHISDVIRISSELIRTCRQQLMQHLIMTWYPDPDCRVSPVSALTNIDVPVISDHIGAEGGGQAEAGQEEAHQPGSPGPRPHPLTSEISASPIWNEKEN